MKSVIIQKQTDLMLNKILGTGLMFYFINNFSCGIDCFFKFDKCFMY